MVTNLPKKGRRFLGEKKKRGIWGKIGTLQIPSRIMAMTLNTWEKLADADRFRAP